MAQHKFPPKGYNQMQYPLPHNFEYQFRLEIEDETKNSTITPLLKTYEGMNAADVIEVNPSNSAFLEETGSVIQPDSIVPKMNVFFSAQMAHLADETDKLRYLKFNWMPIYLSFKDNYEAMDNKSNVEVEDILEMQHTVANKDGTPLYGVKLGTVRDYPASSVNISETFTIADLTTDLKMEAVAFDEQLMWDALQYYSNSSMLASVMGKWHSVVLDVRKPYIFM